jgi:branched-chain amino acid transport system permease protein
VFWFKMQGFVIGAMIMGVGGAVFAFGRGSIGPTTFDHFFATFLIWAMLMVGGSGNNWGAVAGAYVVWGIWTITLQLNGYDLPNVVQNRIFFIRDFLIGALIVSVLLLRPRGLFPEERRVSLWLDRRMRKSARGDPTVESTPPQ